VVAQGGMGAICEARDLSIRRTVAMKVMLSPDKAAEASFGRLREMVLPGGKLHQ